MTSSSSIGGMAGSGGSGGGTMGGTLNWAENFGTTYYTTPTSVAIDPLKGDVVAAGYFYGSVDFGGGVLASDPTMGSTDMFLARFDKNGGYKWAKKFGNGTGVVAHAVAVGTSGKVFVGATTLGAVDLGCGSLPQVGDSDAVLVAFDSVGTCLWSKRFGVVNQAQNVNSLHVDGQENVIVGGLAWGGLDFGGGALDGMYIAKFTKTGTHAWSKAFSGFQLGLEVPQTVVDPSGNIILAGAFKGSANFGGGVLSTGASSMPDAFIAKFAPSGFHVWSKQYGDQDSQQVEVIAADASGSLVVAGDFGGTIDFGNGPMTYDLNETNTFLAKIDASGNAVWSTNMKSSSGAGTQLSPTAVASDGGGGTVIGLALRGPNGFGVGTTDLGGGPLSSQDGNGSLVVASFDASGQYRWALSGGPPSLNRRSGVAGYYGIATQGTAVTVAGQFGWDNSDPTAPPGTTLVLPGKTLTSTSAGDMFLANFVP